MIWWKYVHILKVGEDDDECHVIYVIAPSQYFMANEELAWNPRT